MVVETGRGRRGRRERSRGLPRAGAQPRQARLSAPWARGSRAGARCRRRPRRCPGWPTNLRLQDAGGPAAEGPPPRARRAGAGDARGARPLRRRPGERARGRRAQPRQGAHRGLHDRRQRRDRPLPRGAGLPGHAPGGALAGALAAHRGHRARARATSCRPRPTRSALQRVPGRGAAPRTRCASPTSRSRSSSCSAAASTWPSFPGEDGHRPLRPGGERLHALDRAQPALPGPRHPAAAQGGAGRRAGPLRPRARSRRSPRTARGRRTTPRRSSGWCARRRPPACSTGRIGEEFDGIVTGAVAQGHLGRASSTRRSRAASSRAREGSTSGTGCGCGSSTPTRSAASSTSPGAGAAPGGRAAADRASGGASRILRTSRASVSPT